LDSSEALHGHAHTGEDIELLEFLEFLLLLLPISSGGIVNHGPLHINPKSLSGHAMSRQCGCNNVHLERNATTPIPGLLNINKKSRNIDDLIAFKNERSVDMKEYEAKKKPADVHSLPLEPRD
jgi:hypothetical protein